LHEKREKRAEERMLTEPGISELLALAQSALDDLV
jgi:hypothetical protein